MTFDKKVTVRLTCDEWKTFRDVDASYVPSGLQLPSTRRSSTSFSSSSSAAAASSSSSSSSSSSAASSSPPPPQTFNLFDTFSFSVALPTRPAPERVEFCLRYVAGAGAEYWDNNGGANYALVKPDAAAAAPGAGAAPRPRPASNDVKYADAMSAKLDHWTDFASWNHLVNDSPYW